MSSMGLGSPRNAQSGNAPGLVAWSEMDIEIDLTANEVHWAGGSAHLKPQQARVLHLLIQLNMQGQPPKLLTLTRAINTSAAVIQKVLSELRRILEPAGLQITFGTQGAYRICRGTPVDGGHDASEAENIPGPLLPPPVIDPATPSEAAHVETSPGHQQPAPNPANNQEEVEPNQTDVRAENSPIGFSDEQSSSEPDTQSRDTGQPQGSQATDLRHGAGREPVPWRRRYAAIYTAIVLCAAIPPLFIDPHLPSHIYGARRYPHAPLALLVFVPLFYASCRKVMARPRGGRAVAFFVRLMLTATVLCIFYLPEKPHGNVFYLSAGWGFFYSMGVFIDDSPSPSNRPAQADGRNSIFMEHNLSRLGWWILFCISIIATFVFGIVVFLTVPNVLMAKVSSANDKDTMQAFAYVLCILHILFLTGVAPLPQLREKTLSSE